MYSIIEKIRKELRDSADEKTKLSGERFFKEEVKLYGVKSAIVGKIAKNGWDEIKEFEKETIFKICEDFYLSGYSEEAFIAANWLPRLNSKFVKSDFAIFENWIDRYIDNWAKCDTFCNHTMGDFIELYPEYIEKLFRWTQSENRWVKRASAVSLIVPAKAGKFLDESFKISDLLLQDKDDMVQKGYGWLLKEESRKHQKEVFDFVCARRKTMPRTALRYAIELMPEELRKEAMKK